MYMYVYTEQCVCVVLLHASGHADRTCTEYALVNTLYFSIQFVRHRDIVSVQEAVWRCMCVLLYVVWCECGCCVGACMYVHLQLCVCGVKC